jgi:two-component system sensor histidine kinase KdpD
MRIARGLYGLFTTFRVPTRPARSPTRISGRLDYDRAVHVLRAGLPAVVSLGAVLVATTGLRAFGVASPTTVALTYLLIVLFVAAWTALPTAIATAVAAMLALNFFFMPPVGTFTIADPHNWVALGAFLVVAAVASQLSNTARARERDAVERRNEVARLFDVSRDILLTTDRDDATGAIARHVARRFELPIVTVAVPGEHGGWQLAHGGTDAVALPDAELDRAWASARGALEFDARTRSYGGHRTMDGAGGPKALVPVRIGVRPVGLVALGGRSIHPGTADAIAGIIAIALERARFIAEREAAELSRQRADLSSALLAALGHDLRTPVTAIRVAVTNAADTHLDDDVRAAQAALAVKEIDHLGRLLQEILDMARIEANAVKAAPEWVTAGALVEAAQAHAGTALARHRLAVSADETTEVQVDPRLTSAALAHVLENAAKYSPPGTTIHVHAETGAAGLRVTVTDEGPGLREPDLDRLFQPFVRGRTLHGGAAGTGLGLAITRGLLAAEGGRVWAERQQPGRGARFTIAVPGPRRPVAPEVGW